MGDRRVRSFTVTRPTLHAKGYTVYCVTAKVFDLAKSEAVEEIVIWKRYNDFKKLHTFLSSLHKKLHRRDEFPEFARAKLFGRFDETVIEERRISAQNLLNFIASQPHLVRSPNFQKFFEGGESVEASREFDALKPSAVLMPQRMGVLVADSGSMSADSSEANEAEKDEEIGPLTDEKLADLGGVWQFRQEPENVSLNSNEDDDMANLTDESALSTPLPDADITFFDPLQPLPGEDEEGEKMQSSDDQMSNTWLLSAMTVCASLEGECQKPKCAASHNTNTDVIDGGHTERSQTNGGKMFSIGQPSQFETMDTDSVPASASQSVGTSDRPQTLSSPALIAKSIAGKAGLTLPSPSRSPAITPSQSSSSLKGMDRSPSKTRLVVEKGDYILQAANQICLAQENEASGNYQLAFDFYKSGVEMLLMGVQEDDNSTRRDAVRRKTAYYLMKAEDIYKRHLTNVSEHDDRWAADSRFSPSVEVDPRVTFMRGSVSSLSNYRVLGVINKVLLVLDKITQQTYIIKVLHKSCTPWMNSNRRAIVPTSCPYMVKLHQYFETDNAIYLLLEHASGGRLWDYISGYMSGGHKDSQNDLLDVYNTLNAGQNEHTNGVDTLNIYSGQHVTQPDVEQSTEGVSSQVSNNIVTEKTTHDTDVIMETECSESYAAIFKNSQNGSTTDDCVQFVSQGQIDVPSTNNDDSSDRIDSFDRDFNDISVSKDVSPKTDIVVASDSVSHSNDVEKNIQVNEKETRKPSLQLFSINSVDSEEGLSLLSDSSKRDHIDSIPEDSETLDIPKQTSPTGGASVLKDTQDQIPTMDVAFDPEAVIEGAKNLIENVDCMLSSDMVDDGLGTDDDSFDEEEVFTDRAQMREVASAGFASSTPIKYLGQEDNKLPELTTTTDSPKKEEPITEITNEKDRKSPLKSQTAQRSVLFSRGIAMDRSDESDLKPRRKRTMSSVFSQLDDEAERYSQGCHLPEACVAQWAAEMVTAISTLHAHGLVCGDLRPDNILLGPRGHVTLTYFSRWTNVDRDINEEAIDQMYAAPEIKWLERVGPASDWWSLGALLYELLTGKTLCSCHPSGINSHTQLYIPDHVSTEARSLLQELLHFNAKERLGSGLNGEEDIRLHPFLSAINWCSLLG